MSEQGQQEAGDLIETSGADNSAMQPLQNQPRSIRRDLVLLAAGVGLGLIPSLVGLWISSYLETRRLILDRRINVVKELSDANIQIALNVIPKAEEVLDQFKEMEYGKIPFSGEDRSKVIRLGREMCREYLKYNRNWETQLTMISTLHDDGVFDLKPSDFRCVDFVELANSNDPGSGEIPARREPEPDFYKNQIAGLRSFIAGLRNDEEFGRKVVSSYASRIHD